MTFGSIPSIESLDECLSDPSNPIGMRMRAAYYLRHIHSTSPTDQETVVSILEKGLLEPRHGSLLRHEFAYVMGQMKDQRVRHCFIFKVRNHRIRFQIMSVSNSNFIFQQLMFRLFCDLVPFYLTLFVVCSFCRVAKCWRIYFPPMMTASWFVTNVQRL